MEANSLSAMRRLRLERGLEIKDVAAVLGVSSKTISRWETGETSPTLVEALPLARRYGVTLEQLAGEPILAAS